MSTENILTKEKSMNDVDISSVSTIISLEPALNENDLDCRPSQKLMKMDIIEQEKIQDNTDQMSLIMDVTKEEIKRTILQVKRDRRYPEQLHFITHETEDKTVKGVFAGSPRSKQCLLKNSFSKNFIPDQVANEPKIPSEAKTLPFENYKDYNLIKAGAKKKKRNRKNKKKLKVIDDSVTQVKHNEMIVTMKPKSPMTEEQSLLMKTCESKILLNDDKTLTDGYKSMSPKSSGKLNDKENETAPGSEDIMIRNPLENLLEPLKDEPMMNHFKQAEMDKTEVLTNSDEMTKYISPVKKIKPGRTFTSSIFLKIPEDLLDQLQEFLKELDEKSKQHSSPQPSLISVYQSALLQAKPKSLKQDFDSNLFENPSDLNSDSYKTVEKDLTGKALQYNEKDDESEKSIWSKSDPRIPVASPPRTPDFASEEVFATPQKNQIENEKPKSSHKMDYQKEAEDVFFLLKSSKTPANDEKLENTFRSVETTSLNITPADKQKDDEKQGESQSLEKPSIYQSFPMRRKNLAKRRRQKPYSKLLKVSKSLASLIMGSLSHTKPSLEENLESISKDKQDILETYEPKSLFMKLGAAPNLPGVDREQESISKDFGESTVADVKPCPEGKLDFEPKDMHDADRLKSQEKISADEPSCKEKKDSDISDKPKSLAKGGEMTEPLKELNFQLASSSSPSEPSSDEKFGSKSKEKEAKSQDKNDMDLFKSEKKSIPQIGIIQRSDDEPVSKDQEQDDVKQKDTSKSQKKDNPENESKSQETNESDKSKSEPKDTDVPEKSNSLPKDGDENDSKSISFEFPMIGTSPKTPESSERTSMSDRSFEDYEKSPSLEHQTLQTQPQKSQQKDSNRPKSVLKNSSINETRSDQNDLSETDNQNKNNLEESKSQQKNVEKEVFQKSEDQTTLSKDQMGKIEQSESKKQLIDLEPKEDVMKQKLYQDDQNSKTERFESEEEPIFALFFKSKIVLPPAYKINKNAQIGKSDSKTKADDPSIKDSSIEKRRKSSSLAPKSEPSIERALRSLEEQEPNQIVCEENLPAKELQHSKSSIRASSLIKSDDKDLQFQSSLSEPQKITDQKPSTGSNKSLIDPMKNKDDVKSLLPMMNDNRAISEKSVPVEIKNTTTVSKSLFESLSKTETKMPKISSATLTDIEKPVIVDNVDPVVFHVKVADFYIQQKDFVVKNEQLVKDDDDEEKNEQNSNNKNLEQKNNDKKLGEQELNDKQKLLEKIGSLHERQEECWIKLKKLKDKKVELSKRLKEQEQLQKNLEKNKTSTTPKLSSTRWSTLRSQTSLNRINVKLAMILTTIILVLIYLKFFFLKKH